jgi:hypothetical protein
VSHAETVLERYATLDRALVSAGFPATSPWWWATIQRFYRSGKRELVLRVGRRGGKSSTLCRLAVVEALWGDHVVPPGDVGVVAFISVSRDESSKRIRTITAILDTLRVDYTRRDTTIELANKPIAFATFAASIAGVSGPTCIAVICDEVAKWRDSDTGANPATEVLASVRPTTATMPNARMFLSSSPLGNLDAHAEAFAQGDTARQTTAFAETWLANPSVTEEQTHALEPDERVWKREFAAVPQGSTSDAFNADAVDQLFVEPVSPATLGTPCVVIDPSSGRKDSWTWGVVGYCLPPASDSCLWSDGRGNFAPRHSIEFQLVARDQKGDPIPNPDAQKDPRPYLQVHHLDAVEGAFWQQTKGSDIVRRVANDARSWGASTVVSDQREALMLESLFDAQGLRFVSYAWTESNKPQAIERIRRLMVESNLKCVKHDKLKRELLNFKEKINPSGSISFAARGSGHDDFVALLVTAALHELAGGFTLSPIRRHASPPPQESFRWERE